MVLTRIDLFLFGAIVSSNIIPRGASSEDDTTSGSDIRASVPGDTSGVVTDRGNTSLQPVDENKTVDGTPIIWSIDEGNIVENVNENNGSGTMQGNVVQGITTESFLREDEANVTVITQGYYTAYAIPPEHPRPPEPPDPPRPPDPPTPPSPIYQFNAKATNKFLAIDATTFACGTEKLCNTTLEPENGLCSVECDPCHCDDMCHFYGDCCPDLLFRDSPDTPISPSPYVSCLNEHWTLWNNLTDMWVVSRCPDHPESSTVAKCEHPDNDNPDQATPVSNVRSQVTYRNIFCAQCHGDENVEPWTHQVECRTNTALNTAKSKADLWRLVYADRWCEVDSSPPEGVIPRLCFHADIDSCRENADPVMRDLCSSFHYTVDYYGSSSSHRKYRNIFCALCNGKILDKSMPCSRVKSPVIPYPLTVLLNFNPKFGEADMFGEDAMVCGTGEAFDPFSGTCRDVSCSGNRTLTDGVCVETQTSNDGFTGYKLEATLVPANSSDRITDARNFIEQYYRRIQGYLKGFDPVYFPGVEITVYSKKRYTSEDVFGDLAAVDGKITVNSTINAFDIENALVEIFSRDFSYNASGVNASFSSRFHRCEQPFEYSPSYRPIAAEFRRSNIREAFAECNILDCIANVSYKQIQLSCPFIEYVNRFEENFTFDPVSYQLEFGNYSFFIAPNDFQCCERVLRICVETIANITKVVFGDKTGMKTTGLEQDLVLSIVSLVCISLSLGGLALTFLVYSVLPKLRTLPGKNSMALMFHLFWAQLFFLTASNRTADAVLCQVFGVTIHYFWMASFTWMLMSAYHMHTVFTSIKVHTSSGIGDTKRLTVYSVIGVVVPVLIIASCVTTHLVQHQGANIGYGGDICFLNNPTAIGVFFVAPLSLMLLLNAVFFTKTILAIRSVPDMREVSNKSRKHHVFVYIKLSLLMGFTWIFGITATLFQSNVLQYVFVILTGGQGVMLFAAYCLNQRTWTMVKASIFGDQRSFSSNDTSQSGNTYTVSSYMKSA